MSFKSSLSVGAIGETLFYEAHEGKLIRLDGRKSDFIHIDTQEKLELKTDTYSMDSTPNFFFERYSNKEFGTPGGPWRSLKDGSLHFVYLYVQNLVFFQFNTQALVDRLEELKPSLRSKDIPNKSWITEGFLVPRDLVEDLAIQRKMKVTLDK